MNGFTDLRLTPEDQELTLKRRELQDLENQLVERELHLASLKAELTAFERLYLRVVGVKYAELDELEAQIAEAHAKREPTNTGAQDEAVASRARAQESRASTTGLDTQTTVRFSPSPSLKSLYREVARKLHPDLATDEADRARRHSLMAEANEAYAKGDEARLRAILNEYESSPESVPGKGTAAELIRVIRKIAQVKKRLSDIANEVADVMRSDLMTLKNQVDGEAKRGRDLLSEMATAVEVRIREAQSKLKKMSEVKIA